MVLGGSRRWRRRRRRLSDDETMGRRWGECGGSGGKGYLETMGRRTAQGNDGGGVASTPGDREPWRWWWFGPSSLAVCI
eukprot:scaffold28879_cov64-Cyclotella_meneghiniana.AAC.6